MTPEELSQALAAALRQAVADGAITGLEEPAIPSEIHVERPRQREHGDWATNVALQLAKRAGLPPRDLAAVLARYLLADLAVAAADVAGPGFLNITLNKAAAGELARQIVQQGTAFGRGQAYQGQTINVEFVSANPTGPVHLAGARWAAVGDTMARTLEAQGATAVREYYFNDHGTQIDRFAQSLLNAAKGLPTPQDGYGGQYIQDIAHGIDGAEPALKDLPEDQALEAYRARGVVTMFAEIKQQLHDFGVDFDVYFHEQSLYDSGEVKAAIGQLKANGSLYEADGAWWLKSTAYGDDKDRVVIKSDGHAAYIAGDIAYFQNKRQRGADLAIYLLGADHHGYIARLKAGAAALGDNPDRVEVLIGQMVFLVKDGQRVKMSKRAGTVVTMEDLVSAIGVDAARYALVRSSIDSNLEIDLDLWASNTNDNPVYYVQYAHARTRSVARNATAAGIGDSALFDPATLAHESEAVLLGVLAEYPGAIAQAAELREPHRVARYLEGVAGAYHKWYDQCRVIPTVDQAVEPVHHSRFVLNEATAQVLSNGLAMLGVSAPERM
ncbi:MAG: arginine--tRNA ligase [Bifidobacteriaceae bacterium]|nr:arginine--tRNA ligase [Bifidobacteriaceae bacterium]